MTTATVTENPCAETRGQFPFAVQHEGRSFVLREAQVFARCALLGVPKVKPGAEVTVALDPDSGNAWLTEPRIHLGHVGWRHPAYSGLIWSERKHMEQRCAETGADPRLAEYVDTRPTLGQVVAELTDLENKRLKIPKRSWNYQLGPWDEYISCRDASGQRSTEQRWPTGWFWVTAYVVTGGSEGLYLHVDVIGRDIPNGRSTVILGKTLDASRQKWFECYESAAHIARYLGG